MFFLFDARSCRPEPGRKQAWPISREKKPKNGPLLTSGTQGLVWEMHTPGDGPLVSPNGVPSPNIF